MKSLFFVLASLVTVSASANVGGDMYQVRIQCKTAINSPDHTMTLQVSEGGISGIPEIAITESTIAGPVTDRFLAKQVVLQRAGGPVVFESNELRLSIDTTVAPSEEGTYPATLVLQKSADQAVQYQDFNCSFIK